MLSAKYRNHSLCINQHIYKCLANFEKVLRLLKTTIFCAWGVDYMLLLTARSKCYVSVKDNVDYVNR